MRLVYLQDALLIIYLEKRTEKKLMGWAAAESAGFRGREKKLEKKRPWARKKTCSRSGMMPPRILCWPEEKGNWLLGWEPTEVKAGVGSLARVRTRREKLGKLPVLKKRPKRGRRAPKREENTPKKRGRGIRGGRDRSADHFVEGKKNNCNKKREDHASAGYQKVARDAYFPVRQAFGQGGGEEMGKRNKKVRGRPRTEHHGKIVGADPVLGSPHKKKSKTPQPEKDYHPSLHKRKRAAQRGGAKGYQASRAKGRRRNKPA